ncbi:DUF616 domain-containing protein [Leclercia adecarboxylata]|uniref:DUF616 domain-containing protein n=2 Tax=Leclercia adecarboxylata TaxID=83655 RepID=A0A9X3YE78_9ENTR|nr:glycosyltransferase domain-containing protein [Leclercia adecarboxylata]MBD1403460.1 DUF616 domain-containing protein [Leclercia adecarboxylata]MDC6621089.1 DUF616 domain-containing protein [Leclercia adecarboxylata]MDC6631664.1 DUF616 domain-containing protein [Leclercia adecarboxylata]MDC6640454.1 DUF616 domain-containing protein [Leclercia adecarboxylata]MDC6652351.1 DUF616 domain-containing protein [Leclercia adecarboxylata]
MKKVAIYTCVTGGYDEIKAPHCINPNIDYICFSDKEISLPFPWKLQILNNNLLLSHFDLKDLNRAIKINPEKYGYLNGYELIIYIDGSIEIISDLSDLIDSLMISDHDFFMYEHFMRTCVYDEAMECNLIGHDWYWKIRKQMIEYKRKGFPKNYGLFECSIICRKPNVAVSTFMEKWFEKYMSGVKRDQLSFTYTAWELNHSIISLGQSDARFSNNNFRLHSHTIQRSEFKRRCKSKINRILTNIIGDF